MSNSDIFIKGYIDRRVGSRNATFTYILGDFGIEQATEINYYIYFVLLKTQEPYKLEGKLNGERVTTPYKVGKMEQRIAVSRLLKIDENCEIFEYPNDLFAGLDTEERYAYYQNAHKGLREYIKSGFKKSDIVKEMAVQERLFIDTSDGLLTPNHITKGIKALAGLKQKEKKRFSNPDYKPLSVIALDDIIASWLAGRVYVRDLQEYSLNRLFVTSKSILHNTWEMHRRINIFDDKINHIMECRLCPNKSFDLAISSIIETYYDGAEKRHLLYYPKGKNYISRRVVREINGQSTEGMERRMGADIPHYRLESDILGYLTNEKFVTSEMPYYRDTYFIQPYIQVYEYSKMPREVLPYHILERFRSRGWLYAYADDLINKYKRNAAARRLMGKDIRIKGIEPDIDMESWIVKDLGYIWTD